jgi:hypothetical protein
MANKKNVKLLKEYFDNPKNAAKTNTYELLKKYFFQSVKNELDKHKKSNNNICNNPRTN